MTQISLQSTTLLPFRNRRASFLYWTVRTWCVLFCTCRSVYLQDVCLQSCSYACSLLHVQRCVFTRPSSTADYLDMRVSCCKCRGVSLQDVGVQSSTLLVFVFLVARAEVCVYKGQEYSQGQKWQDGCDYNCECVDAPNGQYKCTET